MKSKIAIVVSKFNESVTQNLHQKCLEALIQNDSFTEDQIETYWVPGAFEIPVVASQCLKQPQYIAAICLGAIIRGDTPHFDYIAAEVARKIADIAVSAEKPAIFGVLTCDTLDQAVARAGNDINNKGWHAAMACLEMLEILKKISKNN